MCVEVEHEVCSQVQDAGDSVSPSTEIWVRRESGDGRNAVSRVTRHSSSCVPQPLSGLRVVESRTRPGPTATPSRECVRVCVRGCVDCS